MFVKLNNFHLKKKKLLLILCKQNNKRCHFQPPNSPYNAGFNAHEVELEQKKKIETLKRQQKESDDAVQNKEPILKSKNVSGPPVYYPPGHEMFAKKEESGAWRAEVRL